MQKALILALLIGAFLLPSYLTAEEPDPELPPQYECLDGGELIDYYGQQVCKVSRQSGAQTTCVMDANGQVFRGTHANPDQACHLACGARVAWLAGISQSRYTCTSGASYSFEEYYYETTWDGKIVDKWKPPVSRGFPHSTYLTEDEFCPPDAYPTHSQMGETAEGLKICYKAATPVIDEPPPECDDVVGNCTPPEDDPKCFRGGAGQQVCFEDPNDKCDVSSVNGEPVYTNCEAGCGFVNDNFVCSEEPDIPNLDDCYVTTNGYACPPDVPEPDDNIDNPDKPINDMKKGDFKDVLIGVETRMDSSNKLTADQIARDKENTDAITGQLAKANGYLKEIDKNAKAIADGMEGLGTDGEPAGMGDVGQYKSELNSMLGITGDESIEDLTVDEINLGEFKDDFAFSLGASNCPQPRAINMLGKTFYMDWGPFCEAFTVMGYLIMAAAYFMATLIAFKGK